MKKILLASILALGTTLSSNSLRAEEIPANTNRTTELKTAKLDSENGCYWYRKTTNYWKNGKIVKTVTQNIYVCAP